MKRISIYISLILLIVCSSCRHKDLADECIVAGKVTVVFDWRNAPDANPGSMALYLFSKEGGAPLRYIFSGREGGTITVPFGNYDAICMSSDNTEWAMMRNTDTKEEFEIYTPPAGVFDIRSLFSDTPELTEDEVEDVVIAPKMLWTGTGSSFEVKYTSEDQIITLYPKEAVSHYIVDIYDVENLEYTEGATMFGTLEGMAGGVLPGNEISTDNDVIIPFTLSRSEDGKSLHAEFLDFGECATKDMPHKLRLHTFLSDGSAWTYSYDAKPQIKSAPDSRHVHLVFRGLPIPHPIQNGGGLKPKVEDWLVNYIDKDMGDI